MSHSRVLSREACDLTCAEFRLDLGGVRVEAGRTVRTPLQEPRWTQRWLRAGWGC